MMMEMFEVAKTGVRQAQVAVFATVFNTALITAIACDATEFRLTGPQLPPFMSRRICIEIREGFEWTFTAATDTGPAELHVWWPRQTRPPTR
jgi:hypothetical protein